MKLAVFASLIGAAAAFAPASNGAVKSTTTSLSAAKSIALPFLPAPENLKGYPGDVGFDPLRISDYFPMDYLREAELKHSRICMLAWTGFVAVDCGAKIYPFPAAYEGVTSATAHDQLVASGAMGNMLVFFGLAELVSYIGVAQMLQGSGREPGDFGLDPLQLLKDKSPEEVTRWKVRELKNGRLAMLAFSGVVTQAVLTGNGFPYVY